MIRTLEKSFQHWKQKWARWNAKWAALPGEREEYISRAAANKILGAYLTRKKERNERKNPAPGKKD